jgi:DNA-binding NarL/FixJ family response regulator
MKLMITDDHAGIREMIRQIAASPGDVVQECASGYEAVKLAREFAPDWVTMDLGMPGMGGLEAIRIILMARPSTLIVVVSDHDQGELRRAAAEAGAFAFVAKDNLWELKALLKPRQTPS